MLCLNKGNIALSSGCVWCTVILSIYDLLFPPGMGALKGGTVREKSFCEFLILALLKETLIQRNVGLLS